MKAQLYLAVMLALPLAIVTPTALAQGVGAGLSGQCYNEDASQGGGDELRFGTQDGVNADLAVVPGEGGITDALVMFATGSIEDGGNTGSACDRYDCFFEQEICEEFEQNQRYDYLEADVTVDNIFIQVCYRGSVSLANDCSVHPTGPG